MNTQLQACRDTGLDCDTCTRHTAGQLAAVCKGVPPKSLTQIFVQLYPNPECASMHLRFASAYRDALEAPPKRPVASERFLRAGAAAHAA